MLTKRKRRATLLIGAVLLTGIGVLGVNRLPHEEADVVEAASGRAADQRPASAARRDPKPEIPAGSLDLTRLQRERSQDPDADLFQSRSFAPEPPEALARGGKSRRAEPTVAPPPPPPPLPFTYLGQLVEGSQTLVFLTEGDRNLSVRKGEVIDDKYRVEDISASELVLVYLPQNIKQSLPIGAPR